MKTVLAFGVEPGDPAVGALTRDALGLRSVGYGPPLMTHTLDQQQPAVEVEPSITVGHENLRLERGSRHPHPIPGVLTISRPVCHQRPGRVQLEAALAVLEQADRRFNRGRFDEFYGAPEPLQQAAMALAREKVTLATPYPEFCRADGHASPHRIHIFRESGYSASGSDAALGLIEEDLNAKPDNFGKLRGADERHLYVWVDGDTDLAIARPFRGGRVAEWEHFGLPTRSPELFEPVEQLWIVDRATLTGWVWTLEAGWSSLDADLETHDSL